MTNVADWAKLGAQHPAAKLGQETVQQGREAGTTTAAGIRGVGDPDPRFKDAPSVGAAERDRARAQREAHEAKMARANAEMKRDFTPNIGEPQRMPAYTSPPPALTPRFRVQDVVMHVRSGALYMILMEDVQIEATGELAYVYRRADGVGPKWLRTRWEMEDGRFELHRAGGPR